MTLETVKEGKNHGETSRDTTGGFAKRKVNTIV